jgi:hypothetical protein
VRLLIALCLVTGVMAFGQTQVKSIEDFPSSGGVTGCSLSNWCWEHDPGTAGSSTGASWISGEFRQFDVTWKYYGGERFHIYLGPNYKDTASTSFTTDTWVYFNNLTNVDNIEIDLNQVTANGDTVIYGMQCYFPKGLWMYVANRSGHAHWYDSNVPCSRKVWTAGVWHHVILKYHRDSAGNETYDSVNFDTKVSKFVGAAGPSDYGLGWGIGRLIVNFQIGGNKTSSGTTAYLKSLTVTGQ